VQWLVTDQLGTPRMIIDKTGSLAGVSRHDYLPFGEELSSVVGLRSSSQGYTAADGLRQKFTQKERDLETGLDYFGARYYAGTQGRFISADAPFADQVEDNPQSWNLYEYAGNNPLLFTDPTGMWKWVDPGNNGKRFIQWEKGDDWYSLSEFIYNETGRDYYASELEKAYFSGGLGPDTIVDYSGAPSRFFTNNRGGLVDTSWDVYLTVLPAAKALKGAGAILRGVATLFTKEAITVTAEEAAPAAVRTIATIGRGLKNVRPIGSGRLAGFLRGNTILPGGAQAAKQTFRNLTGRDPVGTFERVVQGGKEIVYRATSGSEVAKVEIVDHAQRFLEKISFR
jgi:RHS repeat-associated protein